MQQVVAHAAAAKRMGSAARRRKVPRARPPTLIVSDYGARLAGLVDRMRAIALDVLRVEMPFVLRSDAARADATPAGRARQVMDRVRAEVDHEINPTLIEGHAARIARRVSEHQKVEFLRQGRAALGIDLPLQDPRIPGLIDGFVHENVSLITSLQGRTLDQLEGILIRAAVATGEHGLVADEIAKRFDISERHARLIARDQIDKLNARIAEWRHREVGITRYVWNSLLVGHNRRQHHIARHGKIFDYDHPPSDGNPGQAILCKCWGEPVFDDVRAAVEEQQAAQVVPQPTIVRRPKGAPIAPGGFQIGVTSEVGGAAALHGTGGVAGAPVIPIRSPFMPRAAIPAIKPAPPPVAIESPSPGPFRVPTPTTPSARPAPVGFESVEHEGATFYRHVVSGRAYTPAEFAERSQPAYALELSGPNRKIAGYDTLEVKTPSMAGGEIRYRSAKTGATYTQEMIDSGEAAAQEAFMLAPPSERKPGLLGRIWRRLTGSERGR